MCTCNKCNKQLTVNNRFYIYLGTDGLYYDYIVKTNSKGEGVNAIINMPAGILPKMVPVGFDCYEKIMNDIKRRELGKQKSFRFFKPNNK